MSALLSRGQRPPDDGADRYLTISLEPSDRAALHARIEQRFDAMQAVGQHR
ncbi:tRNA (adenosine(37)-N6)-dimethylallyltransferase MiaA, partial [Xylella fastidiosa subsp. multiplex]|nr:tRNA (adenosine(37)-N6)-dimethylallyltransferase MiaA [Xylella fastidiosa subsp. multiplex]